MSKKKPIKRWLIIVLGVFVGLANGFFGGGGGMLCVPLLEDVMGIETKKSHATALAVMLPLSAISGVVYIIKNDIGWGILGITTIGCIVGGILGAFLLCKINSKFLKLIFAVIMLLAGIKMVI